MIRRPARTLGWVVTAVTMWVGPVWGSPNLIGATGLFLNPTARLDEGPFDVQSTYLPARGPRGTTDWFSLAGRYRLDDRTEVHGAVEVMRATNNREGFALGVKRQVRSETHGWPAIALGGYHDSILRQTAAYAVASFTGVSPLDGAPNGLRAHLGLRWDRFEDGRDENAATVFAGLEAQLSRTACGFVEVGSQHHDRVHVKTPWAAGVRWQWRPGSTLTAALATPAYGFARRTALTLAASWSVPLS